VESVVLFIMSTLGAFFANIVLITRMHENSGQKALGNDCANSVPTDEGAAAVEVIGIPAGSGVSV
jgi:hypothetical protein